MSIETSQFKCTVALSQLVYQVSRRKSIPGFNKAAATVQMSCHWSFLLFDLYLPGPTAAPDVCMRAGLKYGVRMHENTGTMLYM